MTFNKLKYSLFLLLVVPFHIKAQTQIGNELNGKNPYDEFGHSLTFNQDGSVVAIGTLNSDFNGSRSTGHVEVYQNISDTWVQIGENIIGNNQASRSGTSVSLSNDGNILAIGAITDKLPGSSLSYGSASVYKNEQGNWVQIGTTFYGDQYNSGLGTSVSLNGQGDIVAIGAPRYEVDAQQEGQVKVFRNNNGIWKQLGSDIYGRELVNEFGTDLELNDTGDILAVGAKGEVTFYKLVNEEWEQVGDPISIQGRTGVSISLNLNGDVVAIGAGTTVHVFENNAGDWTQKGDDISYTSVGNHSVSINGDGNLLVVGNKNKGENAGKAQLFILENNIWKTPYIDFYGAEKGDELGAAVSICDDGSTIAISAKEQTINGEPHVGQVKIYDLTVALSIKPSSLTLDEKVLFNLSPNPAKNQVTIELADDIQLSSLELYKLTGEIVLQSKSTTIPISKVSHGTYVVRIITNKGISSKKMIIK